MNNADLKVLQAASTVLNAARPQRDQVAVLTDYARENMPDRADLPADELATVVALKLLNVPGNLA